MNNWKLLYLILKYGFPIYLLVLPLIAVYGHLRPWQPAERALKSYATQTPIMIGFSYSSDAFADVRTSTVTRSYLLFPSVFTDPKTVTIMQIDDGDPVISESRYGFILDIVYFATAAFGTWWFWFRPARAGAA